MLPIYDVSLSLADWFADENVGSELRSSRNNSSAFEQFKMLDRPEQLAGASRLAG